MRPLPLEPVPLRQGQQAPAFVLGLAMIRGETMPVVDVAMLLSGVPTPAIERFVALRLRERRVALAVTQVLGTRSIERHLLGQTAPLPAWANPGVEEGFGPIDTALFAMLNSARLLDELSPDSRSSG